MAFYDEGEASAAIFEMIAEGKRTLDPFIAQLNMEILWANSQEAEGVIYVTPKVLNPYGTVHGGCLVALADSVAGHNLLAAGKMCVTQSSTVSFLRPASCRRVYCRSTIKKLGKSSHVVSVEATDEEGQGLVTALFTFVTIQDVPPHSIAKRTPVSDSDGSGAPGS